MNRNVPDMERTVELIAAPEFTTMHETSKIRRLKPKQTRAIACLISCPTNGEAAKQARISERTLYTWLDNPDFLSALHAAQSEGIDAAKRRLMAGNAKALDTLEELMGAAKNDAVRRQAALDWLNLAIRFYEFHGDDDRLTQLERMKVNERKKPQTA